ncbi:hydrolase [Budvicia aquatica]|uniref:Hydrolase n=1 Tax=Budvicia aquatica TaxID=82979 RepID=A0A2C6DFB8_9GAMM|nr:hydrolase [Budvicia aquatica]PHI27907.1 hydrolase [Budvicia aquatica]VFS45642.1 putative hydrolase [Budvicia aquatica]
MDAQFQPMRGAANPHIQTLLPRLFRRKIKQQPVWQRLELPDGDFIDLAWSEDPQQARHKPRLVVFHGLEGSFYSPYAHGLLDTCKDLGWLCVVMHFRGCSGEPNRSPRAYHSGETSDTRFFLNWLQENLGQSPTAAVGYSLGGNMLGCYLAEEGHQVPLQAAVIVSAPLMLAPCSQQLEQGFSRIYNRYLVGQLKQSTKRKLSRYPEILPLPGLALKHIHSLREFDDAITAPLHGFKDSSDYYQQCSALPLLPKISIPLLIIHAKDDPFMAAEVIPAKESLPDNIEYQLTAHGGHVGFVGGTWSKPQMWLEQRIPEWLKPYLEKTL